MNKNKKICSTLIHIYKIIQILYIIIMQKILFTMTKRKIKLIQKFKRHQTLNKINLL